MASSVEAVLAQRLARTLCEKCKEPYQPTREALIENGFPVDMGPKLPTFYRPKGCRRCSKTGYRGRTAIHELMPITEDIERLTVERASTEQIKKVALSQGMVSLRDDGLEKVLAGITSLEEVQRVSIQ